jgi:long-chain acyl-CoA synthetase
VNVADVLREHAARGPARPALRSGSRRVSFGELDAASGHVADRLLRDGVRPGDRVALLLPNVPEFAAAYYGVLRAGAVAVPLDPLLTRTEVGGILQDAGAARLLVWRALERSAPASNGLAVFVLAPGSFFDVAGNALWDPPVPVEPDASAVILYTSGTTGEPRGVELSHANLAGNAAATAQRLRYQAGDVVLAALPLCHVFGQTCGLNAVIASGACLVMAQSLEPLLLLGLLVRGDVDLMLGTPTAYAGLLAADREQLLMRVAPRAAISGGAPLDAALHAAWERTTGTPLAEGYGLTETSPVVCLDAPDATRRPGSIGRDGRARRPRPERHEGLLAAPRRDRASARRRRMAADRRPRARGAGRSLRDRRACEGPHHHRGLQRPPARGRGGDHRPSGDP